MPLTLPLERPSESELILVQVNLASLNHLGVGNNMWRKGKHKLETSNPQVQNSTTDFADESVVRFLQAKFRQNSRKLSSIVENEQFSKAACILCLQSLSS